MLNNRPLIRFILIFAVTYGLLLASDQIQILKDAHHEVYAEIGAWVYNTWHPDVKVDITTDVVANGGSPSNDYFLTAYDKATTKQIIAQNRKNPSMPKQLKPIAYMSFKARMYNVIATFFLLALIIATPNSWKRKVIGAIVAIYVLYILVAMKLTYLMSMSGDNPDNTSGDGVWYFFSNIIGNNESYLELYYILIISIWVMVSISKESIQKLTGVSS